MCSVGFRVLDMWRSEVQGFCEYEREAECSKGLNPSVSHSMSLSITMSLSGRGISILEA